ncbi:MAG: hypothetical protein QME96_10525 [Myxococcota bacterium]|nr:hypothetical protein [Myxococcota bacterium]
MDFGFRISDFGLQAVRRRATVGLLLAAVTFAAGGCGPVVSDAGVRVVAPGIGPGDWRTDGFPPARALARAAERLASAGYSPAGPAGRDFLVKKQGSTWAVPVEAGRCYVLAAASSSELTDLDAYLFAAGGATVDQDRRRDNHPVIRHCPGDTGTMYLMFEVFEGAGVFYWAQFVGPAGSTIDLGAVFPGTTEDPPGPTGETTAEIESRAREFAGMVRPRGFEPLRRDPPFHIAAGADRLVAMTLEAESCYTFAAYGGAGATDVDLYLASPDGTTVALDEEPALDARIQWCPVAGGEFELKVSMAGSAGEALLDVLVAPAGAVGGLDGLWLGTRRPPGPTHIDLDEGVARVKARLEALGYRVADGGEPAGEARQLVIRTHALSLSANRCYAFGGVGGPAVADIDLFLYDSAGNEVVADEAQGATPLVQVCPKQDERFRLDVAMRRGDGPYRVVRGESPALGAEVRGLDTVARSRLRAVSDRIRTAELRPLGAPNTRRLSERGVMRFQDDLQQGACYLLVAVGGAGVIDIDMAVLDPSGDRVAWDDEPDAMPTARFCVSAAGTFATDVRMIEGSGEFTLLRYSLGP